ncbi:MAG TPA: hypothetical protein VGI74_22450 [Streptosporangiaceae bacterium]|jgi:hypothetical protein
MVARGTAALALVAAGVIIGTSADRLLVRSCRADSEVCTPAAKLTISLLPCQLREIHEPCSAAAHLVILVRPDGPMDIRY